MPDTASPIELFWLVRCLLGGIGAAILISYALRDNRRRQESRENGAMEIQAHGNIVIGMLLCLVQFIGASLAVPALFLPSSNFVADPSAWATFATFYTPIAVVVVFFLLDGVAIWKYVIRLRVDAYHERSLALRLQRHEADRKEAAATVAHTDEMAASALAHTEERATDAAAHAGDKAEGIKIGQKEGEATADAATAATVATALAVAADVAAARAEGVAEGNAALRAAQPSAPAPAAPAATGTLSEHAQSAVVKAVSRGIDEVTAAIKADTEQIREDTTTIKQVVVPPPEEEAPP